MTAPYYADESVTLHLGDCLDVLAAMEDASIDAVVTDPPYNLGFMGKTWDSPGSFVERPANREHRWDHVGGNHNPVDSADAARTRRVEGQRFQAWCEAWAGECLRVLKPGGHLLAFGGTRTWHRLVCGIEDAGFEVRDSVADLTGYDAPGLMWIQGSGFPKSRDVSKDLTEQRCTCRPVPYAHGTEPQAERGLPGLRLGDVPPPLPASAGQGPVLLSPVPEQGASADGAAAVDRPPDGTESRLEGRRDVLQDARELHRGSLRPGTGMGAADGAGGRLHHGTQARDGTVGRPALDEGRDGEPQGSRPVEQCATEPGAVADERGSQAWGGWPLCGRCGKPSVPSGLGTALKPGWEPVCVARKPLAGTVAANVLAYGTGALNIDGCRVDSPVLDSERRTSPPGPGAANGVYNPDGWPAPKPGERHNPDGRWPPNVVLGPAAAAELDRQSGTLKSGEHRATEQRHVDGGNGVTHGKMSGVTGTSYADTGGASRFFPVFRYEAKAAASERPRGVDGTAHPTVKPLDLMRWLVRLVTPPGGTVADFFAGSGTTGEACIVEGFKCILAEKDPASAELIVARLRKPIQPVMFGLEGA